MTKKGSNPPPPTPPLRAELGDLVEDRVTGFTGIVVETGDWLYGCARRGVQSRELNSDGVPKKTWFFDEPDLTVIEKGAVTPTPTNKITIQLGDEVTNKLNDHEGIVAGRAIYLNGCIRCAVHGKGLSEDGQPNQPWWTDEQQLEAKAEKAVSRGNNKTGGPRPSSKLNPDPIR